MDLVLDHFEHFSLLLLYGLNWNLFLRDLFVDSLHAEKSILENGFAFKLYSQFLFFVEGLVSCLSSFSLFFDEVLRYLLPCDYTGSDGLCLFDRNLDLGRFVYVLLSLCIACFSFVKAFS